MYYISKSEKDDKLFEIHYSDKARDALIKTMSKVHAHMYMTA